MEVFTILVFTALLNYHCTLSQSPERGGGGVKQGRFGASDLFIEIFLLILTQYLKEMGSFSTKYVNKLHYKYWSKVVKYQNLRLRDVLALIGASIKTGRKFFFERYMTVSMCIPEVC